MNRHAAEVRLKELTNEVARKTIAGTITHAYMNAVEAESEQLETAIANHKAGLRYGDMASPNPYGGPPEDPYSSGGSGYGTGVQWKSFGRPSAPQVPPPSLDISGEQIKWLFDAARSNSPYRVQTGTKDFASSIRYKTAGAPLTESGLNNQLPAIQVPGSTASRTSRSGCWRISQPWP
jgi:hypothetical protein